jgi:DNA-binding protein H-NS
MQIDDKSLQAMSLEELQALRRHVDAAIRRAAQTEKAKAKRAIVELANEHGIDLAQLASEPPTPQYRDPDNPFNTWAGVRGRRPKWLRDKLAAGYTLDQLRIA